MIPIVIITYQRHEHLCEVLSALQEDPLSKDFPTYIFIDGLNTDCTQKQQENQIKIIEVIKNYKKTGREVYFFVSEFNRGAAGTIIWGTNEVLKKYDCFIFLLDDTVPKLGFLEYMVLALEHYIDYPDVYAIIGYAFDEIKDFVTHPHASYRFSDWGFATYKQHWEEVVWDTKALRWKKWNPLFWYRFHKDSWGWGWNIFLYTFFPCMRKRMGGLHDGLFNLHHYLKGRVTIWGRYSMVINIGMDGTGINQPGDFYQDRSELTLEEMHTNKQLIEHPIVDSSLNTKISRILRPIYRKKFFKNGCHYLRNVINKK